MKLETFFEKFELFADAPGAVAKVRALVLQLAVQGKLSDRLSSDDSVEELLQKIYLEKTLLVKRGFLKKADNYISPLDDPKELQIPSQWKIVPLSAICASITDGDHLPPPKADTGIPFLVIGDVRWGGIEFTECRHVSLEYYENLDWVRKPRKDDILYTLVGSFGIPVIVRESKPFCVQRHIGIIRPSNHIKLEYLAYALANESVFRQASLVATGIAQKTVPLSGLRKITIPLPPLDEQKRIVAKVDELMVLCDRLEAQQKERETRHTALARAALARFADAPTVENLEFLFHQAYDVEPKEIRKSILTLAVQGKLVSQRSDDGCTQSTLERKDALFSIPENWAWRRLGEIYESSFYGPRFGKEEYVKKGGVPTIRTTDMTSKGEIILCDPPYIRIDNKEKLDLYSCRANDLLVTRSGTIGMMAVFKGDYTAIPSAYLIRFRFPKIILADFYYLYLSSPYGMDLLGISLRSIGVPNVNAKSISQFPAPLPPLAEQRRIVAKVDQMMALVDKLEAQLAAARATAEKLLDAVVHEVLNGTESPTEAAPTADISAKQNAVACFIVNRLKSAPYFGRTVFEKTLFFTEAHVGIPLGGQYARRAAGPLDQERLDAVEAQAARSGWFTKQKRTGVRDTGYKYESGPGIQTMVEKAKSTLGDSQSALDALLKLVAEWTTHEAEMYATLFAVWNDFLITGKKPTDADIIHDFRHNWHEDKKKNFTEMELQQGLNKMRHLGLVPTGRAPATKKINSEPVLPWSN